MRKYLLEAIEKNPRINIDAGNLEEQVVSLMGESAWSREGGYAAFAREVSGLATEGVLIPVKASGYNGRVPPLSSRYRKAKKTVAPPSGELFSFKSFMDLSYFNRHPGELGKYRDTLQAIDRYLTEMAEIQPPIWDTVNERSFALTGDEKFLSSPEGATMLGRINVALSDLHCYAVAEPFFYRQLSGNHCSQESCREGSGEDISNRPRHSHIDSSGSGGSSRDSHKDSHGDSHGDSSRHSSPDFICALIIENKDTFETVSRLQEENLLRFRPAPHLAIYGEGNKITKSWSFLLTIPWVAHKVCRLFYYGDLDPEGINIYRRLQSAVNNYNCSDAEHDECPGKEKIQLLPARHLYSLLLKQGKSRPMKNKVTGPDIDNLKNFAGQCGRCAPELTEGILQLWKDGRMIPQEALPASKLAEAGEVLL